MSLPQRPCPVCKKPSLPCVQEDLIVCLACNEAYKLDEHGNLEPSVEEELKRACEEVARSSREKL